ncbi:MAG TPA: hypothetical protein PKN48_00915 [Bacteroidales bacterium]|nr:hypothetical protein [Bacteroidales bacterium]
MPAKSKKQQRFMGMVHAYKTGQLPESKASPQIIAAARAITDKTAREFAKSAGVASTAVTLYKKPPLRTRILRTVLEDMIPGFLGGAAGGAIPTAITYAADTQNIRQQSGMPPATTMAEKYKGFDTKMFKTIASVGLTFALAKPLEDYVKAMSKVHPKLVRAGAGAGLVGLGALGTRIVRRNNMELKKNA